ncbi:hypothetical protein POM88_012029 [Heracleum sosnowskyi]|uniref:Ubiquitin-like protease family profile domain-containing protein n=1 Tax=Heracleum sosnowskyi TaxID=360622 RepID=A0AAD8N2Z9_9APIA|nr:hypothetical protein POM88_012029 [Heracleum sosnowskyi]
MGGVFLSVPVAKEKLKTQLKRVNLAEEVLQREFCRGMGTNEQKSSCFIFVYVLMDRNWVKAHRMSKEYEKGVDDGKEYTKTMSNSFRWMNIKCPKQASHDGFFCGYYVGCFIEDLLYSGETKINVDFTYSPRLNSYPRDRMFRFQSNWAGYLYNRFVKDMLLMK